MAYPILPAALRSAARNIQQQLDNAERAIRFVAGDDPKLARIALHDACDNFLAIRELAMRAVVSINLALLAREKRARAS